jgi:hypothetical protein
VFGKKQAIFGKSEKSFQHINKGSSGVLSVRKNRFLKTNLSKCCAGILENRQVSCGFQAFPYEIICSSKTAAHPKISLFFVRTMHKIRARLTPWADF